MKTVWNSHKTKLLRSLINDGHEWTASDHGEDTDTWFLKHSSGARVAIEEYHKPPYTASPYAEKRLRFMPSFTMTESNDLWGIAETIQPQLARRLTRGITVDLKRGITAIGKDLQQRLLAQYLPLYERSRAIREERLEVYTDAMRQAHQLAERLNAIFLPDSKTAWQAERPFLNARLRVACKVDVAHSIKLEFSGLSLDQAQVLVDALTAYQALPIAQLLTHPRWLEAHPETLDSVIETKINEK